MDSSRDLTGTAGIFISATLINRDQRHVLCVGEALSRPIRGLDAPSRVISSSGAEAHWTGSRASAGLAISFLRDGEDTLRISVFSQSLNLDACQPPSSCHRKGDRDTGSEKFFFLLVSISGQFARSSSKLSQNLNQLSLSFQSTLQVGGVFAESLYSDSCGSPQPSFRRTCSASSAKR